MNFLVYRLGAGTEAILATTRRIEKALCAESDDCDADAVLRNVECRCRLHERTHRKRALGDRLTRGQHFEDYGLRADIHGRNITPFFEERYRE